jgi:tetratricopeptide (TPR) repeat protein
MDFNISINRFNIHSDQAQALTREFDVREQTAFILNDMVKSHVLSGGHLDQAEQATLEAIELWRELNNLPMLADGLAGFAIMACLAGNYDRSLTLSAEAYNISHSIANVWGQSHSKLYIGYIYWDRGQPDQAIKVMEECIRLGEEANYLLPQIFTRTHLGTLYASLGDTHRGLEIMQLALTIADSRVSRGRDYVIGQMAQLHLRQNRLKEAEALIAQAKKDSSPQYLRFYFKWVLLAEVELALRQDEPKRALSVTDEILKAILQSGLRSLIPAVLHLRGQCFVAMRQEEEARTSLLEARAEAERIGSRWMLLQILTTLADIETDPFQAEHLRQQAQEILEHIASHSPPELQTSFRDSWERTNI